MTLENNYNRGPRIRGERKLMLKILIHLMIMMIKHYIMMTRLL